MTESTINNQEEITKTRKKLKEIYSFTFEKEEKTKVTETKTVKNEETGEDEEVTVTKEVVAKVPYRVIMKEPTRRQVEEAELEFSVEMSKCIKRGILTKAMLAKKYSDTGGLLAEEDAQALTKMYIKYGELSQESEQLAWATAGDSSKSKEKKELLAGKLSLLKKDIINVETSYSNLFNHTADNKAENKVIQWYILNLTYLQKEDEDDYVPMFSGSDFDQKLEMFYEMEESGNEFYNLVGGKVAALFSFWYYSSGIVLREDFEKLDKDIEDGNV